MQFQTFPYRPALKETEYDISNLDNYSPPRYWRSFASFESIQVDGLKKKGALPHPIA